METSIEKIQGETTCTVYSCERKYCNELKRLKEKYPDDITLVEYEDGGIIAHVPSNWFRMVKPPAKREMTDEQKEQLRTRMAEARARKKS